MKPTAARAKKPIAETASRSCRPHALAEGKSRDSPPASSQKIPGSSAQGSTSGEKSRSRAASWATPRPTSSGPTTPARSPAHSASAAA